MLLDDLKDLQAREGWLPEEGLREIAQRRGVPLHRLESLSTFYTHFRRTPPEGTELAVCRDGPLARSRRHGLRTPSVPVPLLDLGADRSGCMRGV